MAAVETKEQVPAPEALGGALQGQPSSEPEVSSTQEDLFEQSGKTGRLETVLQRLFSLSSSFTLVPRLLFQSGSTFCRYHMEGKYIPS